MSELKKIYHSLATYKDENGVLSVNLMELARLLNPAHLDNFPKISEKRSWEVQQLASGYLSLVRRFEDVLRRLKEITTEYDEMKATLERIKNVGDLASAKSQAEDTLGKLKVLLQ